MKCEFDIRYILTFFFLKKNMYALLSINFTDLFIGTRVKNIILSLVL